MSRRSPNPQTLTKPVTSSPQMKNASAEKKKKLPPWIDSLMWSTFFNRCSSHAQWYGTNRRCHVRNGCNLLCIDCGIAICSRCTEEGEEHHGHRTIQIRLSACQTVARVADIKPFLDVSQVQTHVITGLPVVYINKRPKTPGRWPGSAIDPGCTTCKVCSRVIKGIYTFCSIECKVCDYASAAQRQAPPAQRQTPPEATVAMMSKETMTMSGERKRARKATPQRAHLGCTL